MVAVAAAMVVGTVVFLWMTTVVSDRLRVEGIESFFVS